MDLCFCRLPLIHVINHYASLKIFGAGIQFQKENAANNISKELLMS
jgi:hypothetical protein